MGPRCLAVHLAMGWQWQHVKVKVRSQIIEKPYCALLAPVITPRHGVLEHSDGIAHRRIRGILASWLKAVLPHELIPVPIQRGDNCGGGVVGARRSLNGVSYIIHLNIALYMVVSLYFAGKSHVSSGQHVSFKEPC